jgi:kynurenine formamidase
MIRGELLGLALSSLLALAGCRGGEAVPIPERIVDLTPRVTFDVNIQRFGTRALQFLGTDGRVLTTPVLPDDSGRAFGLQMITLLSHTGAHLDSPGRLLRGGEHPSDVLLDHLFGRARVVDLRWHDRHSPIQITDLELTPIDVDDVVLLFVGYEAPVGDEWPVHASLSVQASEWLVAKNIRALGTDMPSIVRYDLIEERLRKGQPPESVWAEYLPLFQAGVPVISGLVNLHEIVSESNVAFAGFPLPLVEADGAPIRAAALVY